MIKKQLKYIFLLITIILSCIYLTTINMKLSNNFYNEDALAVIKELNVSSRINKKEYSKTIEAMLISGNFKEDYIDIYFEINFVEKELFTETLNTFIELNYSSEIINYIYTLNEKNFSFIKESNYLELKDFMNISNVELNKIERYYVYKNSNNIDLPTAVIRVNIGLDFDFYSHYKLVDNLDSYQVLVNKYNKLPDDYIPNDLISINGFENLKMRPEAANALVNMINDAQILGIKLEPFSTFRSYTYQESLYNKYVNEQGQETADTYSARPGFSEHQTGLAADIRTSGYLADVSDESYEWLISNAHQYGFILRYLEETTFITGYKHEPWHIRYVGEDIATDIITKNLTFEEYYDLYLKNIS